MSTLETAGLALKKDAERLCDQLQRVCSEACVGARFAEFYGLRSVTDARALAAESLKNDVFLKRSLRDGLGWLYSEGKTWAHCLSKPFGYPGDFAILEMVYDRQPHPATTNLAAQLCDVWGLDQELPRAVAARKNVLRTYLEDFGSGPEIAGGVQTQGAFSGVWGGAGAA